MTTDTSRALAKAIEPFAAQVYFAPECHRGYQTVGFGPSPGKRGGVEWPDGAAYFCSRGGLLGQVPGEVIAAAFGVFNPAVVVPAVSYGWTLTDAATICQLRSDGATAQLRRVLGVSPDGLDRAVQVLRRTTESLSLAGKPLFAGLVSQGLSGDALTDAWRLADQLREFRGDVHVNIWSSAGFDGAEIGLLTELYRGLPPRSYVRTRAWSDDDLDAAQERLRSRGLIGENALTESGAAVREEIEVATDNACAPILAALGDDLDELIAVVGTWSQQLQSAGSYQQVGPHDGGAPASS